MNLELNDIQGVVRGGFGNLNHACYVLFEITESEAAKQWLGRIAISKGSKKAGPDDDVVNIALTYPGLVKLGVDRHIHDGAGFSVEFEDGMTADARSKNLGDHGESAPTAWAWGGPSTKTVHLLLLLYAESEESLNALYAKQKSECRAAGIFEILRLGSQVRSDHKEHFGFTDGIAQPEVAGFLNSHLSADERAISQNILDIGGSNGNIVAAGEFILGYPNVYSKLPSSPLVNAESDPQGLLPGDAARDIGRNGTYLVLRQLKQNVKEFWTYLDEVTRKEDGSSDPLAREALAAKMVGRWRSGCPLVLSPEKDDPTLGDRDDFGYYPDDKFGEKCPIASHIRRTNPRNAPLERDNQNDGASEQAMSDVNKHRILRRGRPYGDPLSSSMDPEEILQADGAATERGLYFFCINANIGRQFEFIQHTWINNPKFAELYSEMDPLLGDNNPISARRGIYGSFVAPKSPVRDRVSGLKRFVEVRGGAYFFLPGIKALQYLAQLK